MTDDESFQEIAEDIALTETRDMESVEEPFEPLIDDLGLGNPEPAAEQILIYRESPDRVCFVCGEPIPAEGRTLDDGEEYLLHRVNVADSPYPLTERTIHTECWDDYRKQEV